MQIRDSWKEEDKKCKGGAKGRAQGKGEASGSAQTAARKGKRKGTGASQAAGAKGTRGDKGKEFGPNKKAVKAGKHSRWSRHLQREYGVMNLALAIVFTGRVNADEWARRAVEIGGSTGGLTRRLMALTPPSPLE